jgi:hypothetical protein
MAKVARIAGAVVVCALLIGLLATLALGVSGTLSGGPITAVRVSDVASADVILATYEDVPGAAAGFGVPTNSQAIVLARFSGFASVFPKGSDCVVRIVIGPPGGPFNEMRPTGGSIFIRADTDTATATSSIDRSYGPIGSGTYVVKVQARVDSLPGSSGACQLGQASLTVERVRA